jgi:hypothetical protein
MRFIVTGRAIDGLPVPPREAVGAYRASFELLANGADPHIRGVWPHAEERATTLLIEADTAEQLGETLTALPGYMFSSWEAHAVTTAAHVASALGRMEAAVGG